MCKSLCKQQKYHDFSQKFKTEIDKLNDKTSEIIPDNFEIAC